MLIIVTSSHSVKRQYVCIGIKLVCLPIIKFADASLLLFLNLENKFVKNWKGISSNCVLGCISFHLPFHGLWAMSKPIWRNVIRGPILLLWMIWWLVSELQDLWWHPERQIQRLGPIMILFRKGLTVLSIENAFTRVFQSVINHLWHGVFWLVAF